MSTLETEILTARVTAKSETGDIILTAEFDDEEGQHRIRLDSDVLICKGHELRDLAAACHAMADLLYKD